MKYKAVKGMDDILPQDVAIWQHLENEARIILEHYGYSEIRTPILENTEIFSRSIGETTDIVTKEMYSFKDRKGRSLTLRPEGTASIVRAYIEHAFWNTPDSSMLYYIGPMFRSERPQKGRTRQFYQIGVEVFGAKTVAADVSVIIVLKRMLQRFGLENFNIKLNSLGCKKDKDNFSAKLKVYLKDKKSRLCDDCKLRIDQNVLRVLDCKKDSCVQTIRSAPSIGSSLCMVCKREFEELKNFLDSLDIKFAETKNLVRGLDYYTGTVFEITHQALGSQDAIGAGGRYDNLVKDMGGPDTPAVGFALGMERIIIALDKKEKKPISSKNLVYIATLGAKAKLQGFELAERIRKELRTAVLTDIKQASLKSQLRAADKSGAKVVLIIGEDEISKKQIVLKDMVKKEQAPVKKEDILDELKSRGMGC